MKSAGDRTAVAKGIPNGEYEKLSGRNPVPKAAILKEVEKARYKHDGYMNKGKGRGR